VTDFRATLDVAPRRQLRSAALVATLFGLLSLILGLQSWRERRHLDLELLLGLLDALVTLALAYALSRSSLAAAWALLGLSLLGGAYTVWSGLPAVALLPPLVAAIFYARAVSALRFLHRAPPPPR
jgi:hypothetical protein